MKKSDETRKVLLQKAFELIYIHGYQSTSIDDIIATTQVTKGAFYYHFKNKDEMGLAVINEIIASEMHSAFVLPLENSEKPAKDIYKTMEHLLYGVPFMKAEYGCPAANLIQEMSPLNSDFNIALSQLVDKWHEALQSSITIGKKIGKMRSGIDEEQVSYFILSGYWGIRNFGKLYGSSECFEIYLKELKRYLKALQ